MSTSSDFWCSAASQAPSRAQSDQSPVLRCLPPSPKNSSQRLSTRSYRLPIDTSKEFLSPLPILKTYKLCAGDWVLLKPALKADQVADVSLKEGGKAEQQRNSGPGFAVGIAWPDFDLDGKVRWFKPPLDEDWVLIKVSRIDVNLSPHHLLSAGLSPGDLFNLLPLPPILPPDHKGPGQGLLLPECGRCTLTPVEGKGKKTRRAESAAKARDSEERKWEGWIREVVLDQKYVSSSHHVSIPTLKPQSASNLSPSTSGSPIVTYKFTSATALPQASSTPKSLQSAGGLELLVVTRNTIIDILEHPDNDDTRKSVLAQFEDAPLGKEAFKNVGGLDAQIERLRDLVEIPLTRPEMYDHFGLSPPRGILLHGPQGTGKSLLASLLPLATSASVLNLSPTTITSSYHGEAELNVMSLFQQAKRLSPCIVLCDDFESLCPIKEEAGEVERRVAGAVATALDRLHEPLEDGDGERPRVIVVACTSSPGKVDGTLRRPGRLDHELEIPIPSLVGRREILGKMLDGLGDACALTPVERDVVVGKTGGFVGADLRALIEEAGRRAIKRYLPTSSTVPSSDVITTPAAMQLTLQDVADALLVTRPSAMRQAYVETPQVKFSDIGGLSHVKHRLHEAITYPLTHPHTFLRLGIKPPRGVLLYGPPGCSKTLIAKALACEGGMNFLSVKGPEVFSKYVGESERKVREVFGRARAAAPSVIFLDEIDAIAMSRGGDEGGGGAGDRVLTSLLTEMDGVQELNGVLVLAATNRPDVLDQALLRPGRLDRILYVGPPDLASRKEIFSINFGKMAVAEDVDATELAEMTDGCTGAEIVGVCQEAAMEAMNEDMEALHVKRKHFVSAAKAVRRRTTPQVIQAYEEWRDRSGVRSA